MVSHFGQKWLCLFRGPRWEYELNEQSQQTTQTEVMSSSNEEVSSSTNEEVLESLNDNTIAPNSSNETPLSSNSGSGIQHSLLSESLSELSDKIQPISIDENPERSYVEIVATSGHEILAQMV